MLPSLLPLGKFSGGNHLAVYLHGSQLYEDMWDAMDSVRFFFPFFSDGCVNVRFFLATTFH
jgi:hypothetical protein